MPRRSRTRPSTGHAAPKTAFKKGAPKKGGRKKGVPNKTTQDVRRAISMVAERNIDKLEKWLRATGRQSPSKAADLFLRMLEYHIPKLNRTEHVGDGGGPVLTKELPTDPQEALRAYLDFVGAPTVIDAAPIAEKEEEAAALPGEQPLLESPESH